MNWSSARSVIRHPHILFAGRWARVLIEFSVVQATVQLIGATTGIAVVRLLSSTDYGLYTIANSMLAALVILADAGIGAATIGIGGRVWQEPTKLGTVVNTAHQAVRLLRNWVSPPMAIICIWILSRNGASTGEIVVLTALILFGGAFALYASIDLAVPRLQGDTRFIQSSGLIAAVLRLATTFALAFFGLLAETAMLAITLGWVVQYWLTRAWIWRKIPAEATADTVIRAEFRSIVLRQFPNGLFYVVQGQLSIWLLSIFGSVEHVADLGAVTRISIVFGVILSAMQNVIIPRYARCQDPARLGKLFGGMCGGLTVLVLIPVALVALEPAPFLWVLGPTYTNLPTELFLAVLAAAINSVSALAWALNTNRAWFPPPWIWIPVDLLSQLALALTIGVSTVRQVLTIAVFAAIVQATMNVIAGAVFIRRFRRATFA
jgi:O-antigen/teichoic acid export membrane protein